MTRQEAIDKLKGLGFGMTAKGLEAITTTGIKNITLALIGCPGINSLEY